MRSNPFDKTEVFASMTKRGINRIEIEFSGGNDEGGVDDIVFLDSNGESVEITRPSFYIFERNGKKFVTDFGLTEDIPIEKADKEVLDNLRFFDSVENIVYSRYGSFAGDWSVCGTAILDVKEETATIQGQEQDWVDFSFEA